MQKLWDENAPDELWTSWSWCGHSVVSEEWTGDGVREEQETGLFRIFEAVTRTTGFVSLWREAKSDIVLKDFSVHCRDLLEDKRRARPVMMVVEMKRVGSSQMPDIFWRQSQQDLLIDWIWNMKGRKEARVIPVFWPGNCNVVCRRGYRIKSSFAKSKMPFRPPNTH